MEEGEDKNKKQKKEKKQKKNTNFETHMNRKRIMESKEEEMKMNKIRSTCRRRMSMRNGM